MSIMASTPYERPRVLSGDRLYYWESDDSFDSILIKDDSELTEPELSLLFRVAAPPGTYEQTAYFIPCLLEFMIRNPDESRELAHLLVCFVDKYDSFLKRDHIYSDVENSLRHLLVAWTSCFRVVHLDQSKLRAIGSQKLYADYVPNAYGTSGLLASLSRSIACPRLAIDFASTLIGESSGAALWVWALEIARQYLTGGCRVPSVPLNSLLCDQARLESLVRLVEKSQFSATLPDTYWRDLLGDLKVA